MATNTNYKPEELLSVKGCKHNSVSEKACHKPSGGESCAFDGTYIVLNPIRDAAHLVHGSTVCTGHNYESRGSLSSGSRMYRYGFTTDISELDIIYGGEQKLHDAILEIARDFQPSAIFVYSTCVPGVTGEDIEHICKETQPEAGRPVIPVNAPGFLGHKNLGNRIAGEVLLNYVIGTNEPPAEELERPTINFLGEYNIAGDMWNVLPLFEKIGVNLLAGITGDTDFERITWAHRAQANLLVCGRAMINLATGMRDKYGIPYSEISFFGKENTDTALRETARLLGDEKIAARVEEVIKEEEAKLKIALEPYAKILKGKKAIIYSGGVKSWSLITALQDLGMIVEGCGTKKSSLSDVEKMTELVGADKIIHDTSPANLLKLMREKNCDILIAGGRNQYLANKENIPYVDVNQEKHTPYEGYQGLVNLARDMACSIDSPVRETLKGGAPWENL